MDRLAAVGRPRDWLHHRRHPRAHLSPADFGVVAAALSLLTFVYLLADMGFGTYLVQVEKPTPRAFSTAFWYSNAAGIVLTVGLLLLAPLFAVALGIPEVEPVIQGIAPAALLVTLGSVPTAVLRRELKFRLLAIQSVVAGFIGQIVAVVMASRGLACGRSSRRPWCTRWSRPSWLGCRLGGGCRCSSREPSSC